MQDAWRAYLELALGLTEAPRKKAQDAVRRVVGSGGATAAQLQALAEELVATSAANREALTKLVRFEVDRALGAVGLATADEVAELTRRVHELERQLREARIPAAADGVAGPATPGSAAGGTVAKRTPSAVRRATAPADARVVVRPAAEPTGRPTKSKAQPSTKSRTQAPEQPRTQAPAKPKDGTPARAQGQAPAKPKDGASGRAGTRDPETTKDGAEAPAGATRTRRTPGRKATTPGEAPDGAQRTSGDAGTTTSGGGA
ncbi:hypothetical protein O7606_08085 [Micromonospora sp. WMMD882]|uniref:hypothetical protein n=1 Tax=Micromonospora sp. WMMD882 TaxID=3015151 RepID=UPI00248B6DAD|nr:hypothetical protein [Micromonospora sp. WMMD882]WBB81312.1 hypothetical protein O7606_08085 [Micromonospora sp. WMMD882]